MYIFLAKDAPKYVPGYSVCLAFAILCMIASTIYGFGCLAENKQRDKQARDVGLTEWEKTELGDKSPDYRYSL